MKKSTIIRLVEMGTKLLFWCILIVTYLLLLDFTIRCNIESDYMFFALLGIMVVGTAMFGLILWCAFFEPSIKEMQRIYKIHKRNEHREYINRKKHIAELQFNENIKEMHKKFNDFERSRKEDNK